MTLRRFPILFALLSFPAASATSQQTLATPDTAQSLAGPVESAARAGLSVPRGGHRNRLPLVFYGLLGTGAAATAIWHVDADSGGYHDGWTTETDFPDKAVHALASWALTNVGIDLGVRPRSAAFAVCAAGTAFEVAQGYISVYDIAADCVGAAGAAAWQTWRTRRRAKKTERER